MNKERKRELREQYDQIEKYMGIVQIKNERNGKIFLEGAIDLKNRWFSIKMQLNTGTHPNSGLQKDWAEMGEDAFKYSVLEQKEHGDIVDKRFELKVMIKPWLERLEPYGDKGYHNKPADDGKN